ncbi:MAG: ferritin-like domain-containing protein [Limnochordaceae bacterium]|nr:ferritin-like domain-containing protein [Limnochordaceae bacterium]
MSVPTAPVAAAGEVLAQQAPPADEQYRADIDASIQDEISDVNFYTGIGTEAPTEALRLLTMSIVADEYGHARTQAALLGTTPPPAPAPPEPAPSLEGFVPDVQRAVLGEMAAVRRYADLAARAPTPEIRYLFTWILGDEYNHSRLWTAMLHQL